MTHASVQAIEVASSRVSRTQRSTVSRKHPKLGCGRQTNNPNINTVSCVGWFDTWFSSDPSPLSSSRRPLLLFLASWSVVDLHPSSSSLPPPSRVDFTSSVRPCARVRFALSAARAFLLPLPLAPFLRLLPSFFTLSFAGWPPCFISLFWSLEHWSRSRIAIEMLSLCLLSRASGFGLSSLSASSLRCLAHLWIPSFPSRLAQDRDSSADSRTSPRVGLRTSCADLSGLRRPGFVVAARTSGADLVCRHLGPVEPTLRTFGIGTSGPLSGDSGSPGPLGTRPQDTQAGRRSRPYIRAILKVGHEQ